MLFLEIDQKRLNGDPVTLKIVDRKFHVYIVLSFNVPETKVVGVYEDRETANAHVLNLCRKLGHNVSDYGVIKQTVRGA